MSKVGIHSTCVLSDLYELNRRMPSPKSYPRTQQEERVFRGRLARQTMNITLLTNDLQFSLASTASATTASSPTAIAPPPSPRRASCSSAHRLRPNPSRSPRHVPMSRARCRAPVPAAAGACTSSRRSRRDDAQAPTVTATDRDPDRHVMSRADHQPFETDARLSWSLTGNHRACPRLGARSSSCLIGARPRLPGCSIVGLAAPSTAERTRIRPLIRTEPAASAMLNLHSARRVAPRARCTT